MAAKAEETGSQVESVDVDVSGKEIDDKSELTCDSGLETLEACSTSLSDPSGELVNQGDSYAKGLANVLEKSDSDTIQSPRSLTPEEESNNCDTADKLDGLTPENAVESDENRNVSDETTVDLVTEEQNSNLAKVFAKTRSISQGLVELTPENFCERDENGSANEKNITDKVSEEQNSNSAKVSVKTRSISQDLDQSTTVNASVSDEHRSASEKNITDNVSQERNSNLEKSSIKTTSISQDNVPLSIPNDDRTEESSKLLDLSSCDNIIESSLKMSTMSLNEDPTLTQTTLHRAPFSKSAENITVRTDQETSTSQNDLNTEKILSDFANQKTKVSATQKVLPDTPANLDVRYPRLPKEILNQDLGTIYKNVHGIFSTVSGSLKNAYNISHKVTAPKPVTKPVLNTKIINEIFEDYPVSVVKENGADNPEINQEMPSQSPDCDAKTDSDAKKDVCRLQVETLERLLAEQRKEMAALRERVRQQADELQEKDETFKDLEGKMDQMRRSVELAQREKDAAVMRYASSECQIIAAKRAADTAIRAEKAALQELELMGGKLKSAHAEKQRICQMYDDKCHELLNSERELAKTREDIKELEGRLKWTQNRLRTELDAYKSSAERVEGLQHKVSELEAARDNAAANAADSAKARQLESDLKELQATLILSRHEKAELEKRVSSLSHELAQCERERDDATAALAHATAEVSKLRESNLKLEEEAASLAGLSAKAALADALSVELDRTRAQVSQLSLEAERAAAARDTCAARERDALGHCERVSSLLLGARADSDSARAEAQSLTADNTALRSRVTSLEKELAEVRSDLQEEGERRGRENKMLARKVAELTEELAEVTKKLEWEKGENGVLKKKHASAIKEINRELQRSLKRCEQLEAKIPNHTEDRETRAGSVSSLSSADSVAMATEERLQNGHATDPLPDVHVRSADRQALIERIVSLQRAAARRAERCDFLEEHSKQLTDELRNKSRALRHLLCSAPAGALAGENSDHHKRDIARLGGGAMAAVWGGDTSGMTLELSLEMNKRLQAVLEDTILKNITLKENMDTLGKEISRLKAQKASETDAK